MASNLSISSINSDVFCVEQSPNDPSLPGPNTPIVFNSIEMSGNKTREMISISSFELPRPQIVAIDFGSNEPTVPYGFGWQLPIIPPGLNDLNLLPNLFNIPATLVAITPRKKGMMRSTAHNPRNLRKCHRYRRPQ